MATREFKGDFLGFEYNGIHSSEYNIVVTSNGSRFEKNLLPMPQDITAAIPGNDGMYYFNSTFQPITFSLQIAYDNVSELDIRNIKSWLANDRTSKDLIFDEEPYKIYKAKINAQPRLTFICFDSTDLSRRIYKGEGTIQFQCYFPFARARFKTLNEYSVANYPTKNQWAAASKMLATRQGTTTYDILSNTGAARLYNPGDKNSPIMITEFAVQDNTGYQSISYLINGTQIGRMILDMSKLSNAYHYMIDSEKKLIRAYEQQGSVWVLSNRVFNNAIVAGDFMSVEANRTNDVHQLLLSPQQGLKINIVRQGAFDIDYDYLYF